MICFFKNPPLRAVCLLVAQSSGQSPPHSVEIETVWRRWHSAHFASEIAFWIREIVVWRRCDDLNCLLVLRRSEA